MHTGRDQIIPDLSWRVQYLALQKAKSIPIPTFESICTIECLHVYAITDHACIQIAYRE